MKMMQEEEDGGRNKVVMGKIKDSILLRLAAFNPSVSFNSAHASFIQDRIQQVFSSFNTPTHPPYPLLIKRAIKELNEEGGSTEEAISEIVRREHEGVLPLAHVTILDIHLRKLCLDGDIVCTKNGRYVLTVDCDDYKKEKVIGIRRMMMEQSGKDNNHVMQQDQEIEEKQGQGLVSELHSAAGTNVLNKVEAHWEPTQERVDKGTQVYREEQSEAPSEEAQEPQMQTSRTVSKCEPRRSIRLGRMRLGVGVYSG